MARSPNPFYQANSGPYEAVGQGISNLGQLFAPPDPVRGAQAEQAAWAARQSRENVTDLRDARSGRESMGDLFGNYDPGTGDPGYQQLSQQAIAQGIGSGAMDPDALGTLFRVGAANMGGVSDEQLGRAVVGSGTMIGQDQGVSLPDRENIAGRNFGNEQALQGQQDAAAMQRLQATLANERALETMGGGSGGGEGGLGSEFDPLAATRLSDLEASAEEAINNYADDLGLDPGALPPELRTWLLDSTVQGIRAGNYPSPRAAAGALWQQAVRGTREDSGIPFVPFDSSTELDYEIPQGGPSPRGSVEFTPTAPSEGPVEISSDAEYQTLAPGTQFIGPDGVLRRKP